MNVEELKKSLVDKTSNKSTTSKKFKLDLIENFSQENSKDYTCLEVGTHWGYTTNVLSHLFKEVITIEGVQANVEKAMEINKDRNNIKYMTEELYLQPWWHFNLPPYQVAFIDAGHQYHQCVSDTYNVIAHCKSDFLYIIYDDYGNPHQTNGVSLCVTDYKLSGHLKVLGAIGESKGYEYKPNTQLNNDEGVIALWQK